MGARGLRYNARMHPEAETDTSSCSERDALFRRYMQALSRYRHASAAKAEAAAIDMAHEDLFVAKVRFLHHMEVHGCG